MDFSSVKAITIPEGEVTKITAGNTVLWEKVKYKNLLPLATDLDRVTIYNDKGYKENMRLSSSTSTVGSAVVAEAMCTSGFIPCEVGDVLRIKGITPKYGTTSYVISFDSTNARIKSWSIGQSGASQSVIDWEVPSNGAMTEYKNGVLTIPLTSTYFGTGFNAIRFSAGVIDENTIVTINEEITE